jgi:hypothetical protein
LVRVVRSLRILEGSEVGASGVSWQAEARRATFYLDILSAQLNDAANGDGRGPIVMPSISEATEEGEP